MASLRAEVAAQQARAENEQSVHETEVKDLRAKLEVRPSPPPPANQMNTWQPNGRGGPMAKRWANLL